MSICMPLSDESFRLQTSARPPLVRMAKPGNPSQEQIGTLEERLSRLEEGQRTALELVRQAMVTLKQTQAKQDIAHHHAIERLAARLGKCEIALNSLNSQQRRDDEAMRERLFAMSETLESVRTVASAAVRPGALRKLERSLGQEIEACAGALRTEFGDRITEAVEAAESRSAQALDALEEHFWDDIIELARRFDGLADTVVKVRRKLDEKGSEPEAAVSPFSIGLAEIASCPQEQVCASSGSDKDAVIGEENPDVIPFPAQAPAERDAEEGEYAPVPASVGAMLCAAASRVEAAGEEPEASADRNGPPRAFAPLKRVASSAGSAVVAVCIMGGLSLLAGPTLGPSFQGAPPAFAHDRAGWSPVAVEREAVTLTPHLEPVLRSDGHPVRKAGPATSGH